LVRAGRLIEADREYRTALALHPELWDAQFGLADVALRSQKPEEAITELEELLKNNPDYVAGYQALAQLHSQYRKDAEKASYYLRRFKELTQQASPEISP
jgi:predicted Zn-dependent protease